MLNIGFGDTDFTSQIMDAKGTGGKIIFLFLDPKSAAMFLEQAYNLSLVATGTQVFLCETATVPALFQYFSPGAPVYLIMKGVLGIFVDFHYAMQTTSQALTFINNWREQPATVTASNTCANTTDDDNNYMLYRSPTFLTCGGFNFSAFAANGSDILPVAAATYDATNIVLQAMHNVIYVNGLLPSGEAIQQNLMANTSYRGVTGLIEFNDVRDFVRLSNVPVLMSTFVF